MAGRQTNNELLVEILSTQKEQAAEQFKHALNTSTKLNAMSDRVKTLEAYLKSDPDTKSEGVVEKLNRIDLSVNALKTKAAVFGFGGAGLLIILKWMVTKIF